MIEMKKDLILNKIFTLFSPKPKHVDIWYEDDDEMYRSIVRFEKNDEEFFLNQWDDEGTCISEICITSKTLNQLNKKVK